MIRDFRGLEYVGKSSDIRRRLRVHFNAAKNQRLHRAIQKYGVPAFAVCIVLISQDHDEILAAEVQTIRDRGTYGSGGYNDTAGGDGGWEGKRHSPESRKKMSASQLRVGAMRGRQHTPETRRLISETHLGRKATPETLLRMREVQLGKVKSSDVRDRMRAAQYDRHNFAVRVVSPSGAVTTFETVKAAATWANVTTVAVRNWCSPGGAPGKGREHLGTFSRTPRK